MTASLLHTVRLHDSPPQPWRNGGGSTRELLRWPSGATSWRLRVSVATIAHSGPFSAFPGVQRWFAVIDGAGVRLALPDGPRTLTPDSEPACFDGEAAPGCHLIDGPTHDLNLMCTRDAGRARLWRGRADAPIDGATRWRGVYAATPTVLTLGEVSESVAAGTLLWSESHEAVPWQLHRASTGAAWFMALAD